MGASPAEPGLGRGAFARLKSSILCARDVSPRSAWDAIGWWESRRVSFNLIVGSAGILSCIVVGVVGLGASILFDSDFGLPDPPAFALVVILIYGIMANICFTGGWLAELVVRRLWPREADRFATVSFSLGLVFSVLLTLTPAIVIGAGGIFGLFTHLFGGSHG
jgi:ABC-type branched-subunit amino acid transport system permease subunit